MQNSSITIVYAVCKESNISTEVKFMQKQGIAILYLSVSWFWFCFVLVP
jgi:hypothetical protein